MKPYYDEAGITIFHGDCREILPDLAYDLIITDPPYGISHASGHGASWQNTTIQNDHDTSLRDWIMAHDVPMAVFDTWKSPRPAGVRAALVWDKGPASGMGDLTFPWKGSWELIWICGDGWHGRRDEGVLRNHFVPPAESQGRRHPNEKPVTLIQCLLIKAPEGIVCDPCCCGGTTLIAARDVGRRAIGIEIEERYCAVAVKRLGQGVFDFEEPLNADG